jgi:hypothetical protein
MTSAVHIVSVSQMRANLAFLGTTTPHMASSENDRVLLAKIAVMFCWGDQDEDNITIYLREAKSSNTWHEIDIEDLWERAQELINGRTEFDAIIKVWRTTFAHNYMFLILRELMIINRVPWKLGDSHFCAALMVTKKYLFLYGSFLIKGGS